MSGQKRPATTELNHENWDQEDPVDKEEARGFKMASKDVLEKRVIRTAKRRSQATVRDGTERSVFSGFGGVNRKQLSSFDFLAKLTNDGNANNLPCKSETPATTNFNKTTISFMNSGINSISGTSTPLAKSSVGISPGGSSLFGGTATQSATNSVFSQSVFSTTKSTNESPFKIETITTPVFNTGLALKTSSGNEKPAPISSNIFGATISTANSAKSFFPTISNITSSEKQQNVSSFQANDNSTNKTKLVNPASSEKQQTLSSSQANDLSTDKTDTQDETDLEYYCRLKDLNESVLSWIKKHVEATPVCVLIPVFKDYEKHLKKLQDERDKIKEKPKADSTLDNKQNIASKVSSPWSTNTSSSMFPTTPNLFANKNSNVTSQERSSSALLGLGSTSTSPNSFSATSPKSGGFSFGITSNTSPSTTNMLPSTTNMSPSTTNISPFSANNFPKTNGNGSSPFSFGIGKPFSFNLNVQKNEDTLKQEKDVEDEPPKVEYTPIIEENSVFDKKCKIFVKKDGNFIDKGVATLYIKKVEDSGKHQLLVRANTALGNVLLNLILVSSIPTQRMGKTNVMMVCIPTPDSKPPPTPILIRVKTSEEADELLEILNKYKA